MTYVRTVTGTLGVFCIAFTDYSVVFISDFNDWESLKVLVKLAELTKQNCITWLPTVTGNVHVHAFILAQLIAVIAAGFIAWLMAAVLHNSIYYHKQCMHVCSSGVAWGNSRPPSLSLVSLFASTVLLMSINLRVSDSNLQFIVLLCAWNTDFLTTLLFCTCVSL